MASELTEIESLNGQDTSALNSKGWYLVTHYRVRPGTDGSNAYNNAVKKIQDHNRHAGIRTITRAGATYYEIWDLWK